MTSDAVNQDKGDKRDGRQLSPEQAAAAAMVAEARRCALVASGSRGVASHLGRKAYFTASPGPCPVTGTATEYSNPGAYR